MALGHDTRAIFGRWIKNEEYCVSLAAFSQPSGACSYILGMYTCGATVMLSRAMNTLCCCICRSSNA